MYLEKEIHTEKVRNLVLIKKEIPKGLYLQQKAIFCRSKKALGVSSKEESLSIWLCTTCAAVASSSFGLFGLFTELVNDVTIMNDDTFFNMLHW